MVSSAILSCVYAIIQNKFKYEFLKRSQNTTHYYPVGFIGNQNMHANWLVPNVFMAGWLAQNMSLWWLASIPLLVYVIKLNHCRTAYIGLLIGGFYSLGLYVGFLFAGVSLAILSLIYLIGAEMSWWTYGHGGITTLRERINYWRVALRQIRKTPIFGVGFDVFQTKVPFLQLEINEQTKGEFLKFENYACPYPQKCHNDYLQHVLDNGLIGLVGILFLVGLALSAEISSLLVAAFVSLLACGLFFHTFHVIMTNIIFWFLCFTLIRSGGEVVTLLTIPWYVVIIFGVLFLKYTLSRTLFDITFHDYFRNNCTFPPTKALKHNPKSSMVHTYAGQYYFKTGNITKMFEHSLSALAYHDGAQRYWELWSNLGTACFLGGGLALAEHCHKTALKFWPEHKNAKKALDELNRLRQHFVTVTPVNPNEKMVEKKAI
uniref:Putative O-antigen ligase n=1 Tax=viral metagenome TaxID=1070528 RepID=A0A6M3LLT0_9ZZZZ